MSVFFLAQVLFWGLVIVYSVGVATAVVTTLRLLIREFALTYRETHSGSIELVSGRLPIGDDYRATTRAARLPRG